MVLCIYSTTYHYLTRRAHAACFIYLHWWCPDLVNLAHPTKRPYPVKLCFLVIKIINPKTISVLLARYKLEQPLKVSINFPRLALPLKLGYILHRPFCTPVTNELCRALVAAFLCLIPGDAMYTFISSAGNIDLILSRLILQINLILLFVV